MHLLWGSHADKDKMLFFLNIQFSKYRSIKIVTFAQQLYLCSNIEDPVFENWTLWIKTRKIRSTIFTEQPVFDYTNKNTSSWFFIRIMMWTWQDAIEKPRNLQALSFWTCPFGRLSQNPSQTRGDAFDHRQDLRSRSNFDFNNEKICLFRPSMSSDSYNLIRK